jgi:hypothetical protein
LQRNTNSCPVFWTKRVDGKVDYAHKLMSQS